MSTSLQNFETWRVLEPGRRYVLRADPRELAEVACQYGWPTPERMLRASRAGGRTTLWLGPDEWLLLDERGSEALDPVLSGAVHSWVEVTDRQVGLELAGNTATDLLASACPRDLALDAFVVNECARTIFGRSEIVLWRTAEQIFRLECWRSFLPYVQALLRSAR